MPAPDRAPRPRCGVVSLNVERQTVKTTNVGGDGERQLGAGPEARVGGHHFQNIDGMAVRDTEALHHLVDVMHDALVFRSCHAIFRRTPKCDLRAEASHGKAYAAEPPAETTVEVEETQMQSRRYRHGYAVWHQVCGAPQKYCARVSRPV
jgi:hypothetical protein